MALVELFAQTTRETPSASMSKTFVTPTLLPVCCVCRLVRVKTLSSPDRERWVTPRTYRKTHGAIPTGSLLTHTYCPTCFTKAKETVVQYFRQVGATA